MGGAGGGVVPFIGVGTALFELPTGSFEYAISNLPDMIQEYQYLYFLDSRAILLIFCCSRHTITILLHR